MTICPIVRYPDPRLALPAEPVTLFDDALRELAQVLERHFKRPLKLQVEVQPELIGGVRVLVGDEVLDLSVKARLDQMKVALTA